MYSHTGAFPLVGWSATCCRGCKRASTASSVVSQMRTLHIPGTSPSTERFRAAPQEISVAGQIRSSQDDAGPCSCRRKGRVSGVTSPTSPPRATPATAGRNHQGRRSSRTCGCSSMVTISPYSATSRRVPCRGVRDGGLDLCAARRDTNPPRLATMVRDRRCSVTTWLLSIPVRACCSGWRRSWR
jgi:hypothetical protein